MDLFFAAVPIAFLIFVMTKKNGLPSTVAFALAVLLTYLVRISYFKTSPNLAIQERPEFFQSLLADNSRRIRRSISGHADNHSNEANEIPLLKPLLYPHRR